MPQYEVALPNGKKYRVNSPEPLSQDQVWQAVQGQIGPMAPEALQSTAELEAAKSAPFSFGDVAKSFSSGLIGGGKSLVDVFGAGTDVSKGLGEAQSYLQQSLTPERQAEIARRQELESRAAKSGSLFQEAKAFLGGVTESPIQSLTQAAGSSVPSILTSIAALPAGAPVALALGVRTIAELSIGALQGVGEYKGSVFDAVKAEYIRQGKSPVEADQLAKAAQEYSREKAFEIGGSAVLGALDAATGVEPSIAKAIRKASPTGALSQEAIDAGISALPRNVTKTPTRIGQLAKGVAAEAPLEGAQGAFGQYGQNVALQQAGADVSQMEGVLGAGLRDAAVGALFGGAASPLSMKSARQEYETEQFLRQAKAEQDRQREADAALKRAQEERARVEEGLGVPKMLALPAPSKPYEEPKNPLVDPVGRVTEDELGKAIGDKTVVNYINKYRKENNLPKLKSYSIEDIKDAMTAQNPEGEEGALNAILAYKTNYQNETYTPKNILESALAKNIATETKGWTDFLNRATGKTDLNTMSQPQLHSVSNALEELRKTGRTGTEAQLVLPEGSNATRFTQDQYNSGVTAALLNTSKEKPVTYDEALKRVQTQKGVDSDQAAERLLRAAASNDDLIIEKGTGFQATSKTGTVLGTYATKAEAQRNHRRADINPVETELVMPRIEEATRPETELPEGYQIKKEDTVGSEAPAAYVIREDGSQKNASQTFSEEADAKERLNILARKREANAAAEEAAADRVRQDLEKRQAAIAGETGTVKHKNAVNAYEAAVIVADEAIAKHADTADALRTPLKIVPIGKKSTKAAKHTVIKEGKVVASFDTNDKAQAHVLSLLNDKDLGSIVKRGGTMGQRAKLELDMRERPGVRGGTTAGLEAAGVRTPEVEAKLKELEDKLIPMLRKFGLENVGLKVVRAIENDADGAWGGLNNLIRIAFNADKPIKTMRHEALHALFDLGFFTPQQWEALKREAKKTWVDKYLKNVPFNETMSRFDAYTEMGLSDEAILEEAIADAFGDWEGGAKPPPGMMAALFKRMQQFFSALRAALTGAGFESADEIFGKIERGELKSSPNTWKATPEDEVQAAKYSVEHGITPYVSEGQLEIPLDVSGEKYSIKQPYSTKQVASAAKTTNRKGEARKPKFLKNDPATGLPMNANGTVTLYYPTTNEGARDMARAKVLKGHSPTANRIYLTNESSAGAIEAKPGMIQQPVGGANVLLQIDPALINLIQEHSDGRKDFFIPIAEGEVFAEKAKMTKLFTLNAPRDKGLHPNRTLNDVAEGIAKSVNAWKAATPKEREAMAQASKDVLAQQHNVTALFGANAKLEKTNIGDYGLTYKDKKVMSTGLGLASAQRINDEQQATTCPKSAICEALCLGETSGQNELYGGEGPYRSGPRLSQYLKTEALVVNPEAFTTTLIKQIEAFRNEAKELDYYPAIRLNVTSDLAGKYLQPIIDMFPDVMFYDYTKLITAKPVAANHHLTYSSTGASQVVNGENIYNKESNWDQMVNTVLPSGRNVAMAFTSRNDMPEFVKDERTGKTFEVWNGDEYDARFLDPKREDGVGWIIGLTNKDRTTAPEESAKKHNGFFLDYDAKRDGNTLVIPDQSKFKKAPATQPIKLVKPGEKLSLRAREVPKGSATAFFKASQDIPRSEGIEAAEQVWSGGIADFGDKEAALLIARMPGYSEYAGEIEQLAWEHLAGGLYNEDRTVNKEAVERDGRFYVYRYGDLDLVDEINQGEYEGKFEPKATTLSLNFAKAFKNFAGFDEEDKANKGWMRIAVKPESIIMLGSKSSEMELVVNLETVDTGDAQIIDESFEPVSPQAKFSLRIPETKGFKQWVGKDPIIPASDTSQYKGGSAVFQAFHGTTYSNITVFDPERGSQQGALGAGPYFSTSAKDASSNYAGIGPDLKLRIELLADQLEEDFTYYFDENRERLQEYFDDNNIKVDVNDLDPKAAKFEDNSPDKYFDKASKYLAQKQLKGDSEGLVMPVYIKLQKPFDMTSKKIEFMYDPDSEGSEVDDWGRLIDGISTLADEMYVVADKAISAIQDNADGMTARELRDIIRDNIALYDDPFTGEPSSPNQFLQYLLKELGYDGIIQNASDEYSTMVGVERSRDPNANRTFHIMPFTPQQIKSATGNSGNFDPTNKDIRYSLRTPDTKEFKQFIEGSKVVDENGEPLVVYHATGKNFNAFDPRKLGQNTKDATAKLGFFFAGNVDAADEFMRQATYRGMGDYQAGANVIPAYLSIKNPFEMSSAAFGMQMVSLQRMPQTKARKFIADFLEQVKDEGYDGIVIRATKGEGTSLFKAREFGADNWVAFEPNQIKSAIGNVGSYGQRAPTAAEAKQLGLTQKKAAELQEKGDIRFSLRTFFPTAEAAEKAAYKKAPPSTPEFKRFFGASKVMEEGRAQPMYHASMEEFNIFRENRPIFISPDAGFAEDFIKRRMAESGSLSYLSEGAVKKKTAKIYPLWVRAETPFDFDNKEHVRQIVGYLQTNNQATGGRVQMAGLALKTPEEIAEGLSQGRWTFIEDGKTQEALKALGFDSFYTFEGGAKNLAVFKANQVKSITGNLGGFDEGGDIRYSLKKFDREDLPKNDKPFTLPENTMLFHGSHETRAKEIEAAGKVLVPSYPIKTSGGTLDEGGLIFFGDQDIAQNYANSEADPISVQAAIEKGEARNPGVVFETVTDKPYRLMSRYHKLTKAEADKLNSDLGIPDYKRLKSGDSASIAAGRAFTNSRVVPRYKTNKGEMASVWPAIFRSLGFDGFYDNHNAPAVAMTADNGIKLIGDDGRMVKYSLPTQSAAYAARRDETTTRRENKGVIDSILESFAPESMANLRAAFIHRYNQLGVIDKMLAEKMGGKVLLADVSAEAAANMSDLSSSVTYSAFGIGNRKGGIPVYKNGATTIDNSVKGPLEILAPLAQFNDPVAYQDYQYWAGVQRGKRFMADGREKNFEAGDIALVEESRKKFLAKGVDFRVIQKEMNTFNDGVVNYMIATGVISAERGAEFKKHMDYIPFFRQVNGDTTVGPKIFNSISGVKPPKKLKGSEAPLTDYLESIVRNTQAAINAGMKNVVAAQRAVNVAMQLGPKVGAQRLNVIDNAPDTVQVLENGKQVSYRVADQLFINAVKNLNMSEMPFLGFLSGPADLLRNLVTKDPGFMLANMARDSLSAWTTSGVNITPIASTAANFAKALGGKSATYNALLNGGILGGYEFSTGLLNSANVLEADLNKKYGAKGMAAPLGVFKGVWDALERGTEASDAATRMAVYDRVLEETGNETEALYRALEVMNFNRKGSSPVARILTAAIPFLNARIQGLDVLYRTAFGKNVTANNEAMQKAFFVRGMTLMALSAAYFLAVSDDEEWKKQEQETKDNYWIFPGVGKFPTPFEVGFLFKTVPERIMAYTLKDDTGQDLMNSMRRGLLNTFAFNPIPQVAKPLVEYAANYNFFTGRPIVGQGLEGREVQYQVGPTTTHSMEWLGKQLNLSPIKLEQVYGGYTGTMGMYALTLFDSILNTQAESPNAAKRLEQLPVFKRFAADPEARGNITQYYELKRAVDAAVETQNYLLRAGSPEEFEEFMERNAGLLASKQYVASIEKTMKGMREMRKMVDGAQMTADEKKETLIAIGQAENDMTQNIQTVKKMISEL